MILRRIERKWVLVNTFIIIIMRYQNKFRAEKVGEFSITEKIQIKLHMLFPLI